jgi:fatty-acyl-CoA synthase
MLVLQPAWDAEEAAFLLDRFEVTAFSGTDAMTAALLDAASDEALRRLPFCGHAAFDPALADLPARAERRGLKLVGLYGMSEIQALFARRDETEETARRILPGGKPVSAMARVRVRDSESGELLGVGESGELEISGPSVMKEYFGNPAATADAMTEDGFVRTGDLGRLLDDGSFVFDAWETCCVSPDFSWPLLRSRPFCSVIQMSRAPRSSESRHRRVSSRSLL